MSKLEELTSTLVPILLILLGIYFMLQAEYIVGLLFIISASILYLADATNTFSELLLAHHSMMIQLHKEELIELGILIRVDTEEDS